MQGRYRILERLAAGAMGVVYRGERVELARPVAVKFLHPWIAAQPAFRARFETEARAMSRLNHPNCVSVIDFGVEGSPYVIMDFVTGGTLRKVLGWGRLSPARAVAIARQLLAGLAHAHGQGIIHRDLKPDNMILTDTDGLPDHIKILDFGLAKLRDGPAMTSGLAIGTPSYMSPEQTGAPGEIDGRTDIYAIGVVLYEMLVGAKPFAAEKVADILVMHRDTPPKPLRQAAPAAGISPALEAVVLRALEKKPADRFQTAAEFAAALDEAPESHVRIPGAAGRPVAGPPGVAGGAPPPPIGDGDKTIADSRERTAGGSVIEGASAAASAPLGTGTPAAGAAPPKVVPPAPRTPAASALRRWLSLGGMVVVAIVLVFLGIRRAPGNAVTAVAPAPVKANPKPVPAAAPAAVVATNSPAPALVPPAPVSPPPVQPAAPSPPPLLGAPIAVKPSPDERRAEGARLVATGQWQQGLGVLEKASREHPENALVEADLANVALEHSRWAEGAQAARVAGQRDPHLRSDERLVKNLIRALAVDKGYERTEDVLHGFGAAAVPFLKIAAAHDKNPIVRERANEILRERGPRPASHGTFSRPSQPSRKASSNHSIFTR